MSRLGPSACLLPGSRKQVPKAWAACPGCGQEAGGPRWEGGCSGEGSPTATCRQPVKPRSTRLADRHTQQTDPIRDTQTLVGAFLPQVLPAQPPDGTPGLLACLGHREGEREREGECVRLVCMRRWHTFVHFCVYECAPVCFVGVITCMWGFVYEHVCAYFDGCPCVRTHAFVCTYKDL